MLFLETYSSKSCLVGTARVVAILGKSVFAAALLILVAWTTSASKCSLFRLVAINSVNTNFTKHHNIDKK